MRASEIARFLGAELIGSDVEVTRLAALDQPAPNALMFSKHDGIPAHLDECDGFLLLLPVSADHTTAPTDAGCIRVPSPRDAFAQVANEFFNASLPDPGIHPSAVVEAGASIDPTATIGPLCHVASTCTIGARTILESRVVLLGTVDVGVDCRLGPGTSIGHPGFGFGRDDAGNPIRIPHVGGVHIHDHVELGALNSVASGTLSPTTIDAFVKTDDHVHIAHNVHVGMRTLIASCASIAGSVTVGQDCWISPNATILNGLTIGDEATIGLGAVVLRDVDDGATVMGPAARPLVTPPDAGA